MGKHKQISVMARKQSMIRGQKMKWNEKPPEISRHESRLSPCTHLPNSASLSLGFYVLGRLRTGDEGPKHSLLVSRWPRNTPRPVSLRQGSANCLVRGQIIHVLASAAARLCPRSRTAAPDSSAGQHGQVPVTHASLVSAVWFASPCSKWLQRISNLKHQN